MAQLMPLPLNASCFSKIQLGFTLLVLAHLGSPGKRAIKRVFVRSSIIIHNTGHIYIQYDKNYITCLLCSAVTQQHIAILQLAYYNIIIVIK